MWCVAHRDLLWNLARADIKVRYQGSWLGIFWSLINPIAQIALYIFVFSIVFRVGIENFTLYLVSGIVHYVFFSQAVIQGSDAYVHNGSLLGKVTFPRILIPLAGFLTSVYFWSLSVVIFLALFSVMGGEWGWVLVWAVPTALLFLLFVGAVAVIAAVLTVDFRDLRHLLEILTMFLFWLTPIPYTIDMVPEQARVFLYLNPLIWFIESFHSIFYYAASPDLQIWVGMLVASSIAGFIATIVYRTKRHHLVERL